ncbi:MAG: response regulator [Candidatus Aminicenantes bacterium]|nr:response regulator [Candidatus Aminicenantes bacterium]
MKTKNILLIDFEDSSIKTITNLLESNAYKVTVAKDGLDGYEKFKIEKPDLIIMEPMLPKLHGFDLRKRIVRESQGDIPFIIITKFYKEEQFGKDGVESFDSAAFFKKPVDPGTLLNTIDDLFSQEEKKSAPPVSYQTPDKPLQPKSKPQKNLFDDDIEKKISEAFSFSKKTSSSHSSDKEIDKKIEDLLKMRLSDIKSDTFHKKPRISDTRKLDDYSSIPDKKPETEFIRKDKDEPAPLEKTAAEKPLITGADLLPDAENDFTEKSPISSVELDENEIPYEETQIQAEESIEPEIDIEKEESKEEEEREEEEEEKEEEEAFPVGRTERDRTEEYEIEYTSEAPDSDVETEEPEEKEAIEEIHLDRNEAYIEPEPDRPDDRVVTDEALKAEIFGEKQRTDKTEIYERLIEEPYQPEQEKENLEEDTYLGIKVGKRKKTKKKKPVSSRSGKKTMILSIAALVVVVISVLAYFLVFRSQKEPPTLPPANGFLKLQQQDYIEYEGLQVYLDNQSIPLNLSETMEISEGVHQIRFEKDNKTYTQDVQILRETTKGLLIPLFPVTITITPRGEIWEGELKLRDSAPNHTLYHLPVDYTYTFKQAGYQDVTQNIYIDEDNILETIEIELPRVIPVEPGTLEVQVFPSGQVFEGNQSLATFPPLRQNLSLSPGSHTLRFTTLEEGCEDKIKTYQISSGQVLTDSIYLCFGFIDINSNPPGALITIDNNERDIDGNLYGQTPRANVRLPVGIHLLSLKHPDHPQKTVQIVIRKNERLNRSVNLNE